MFKDEYWHLWAWLAFYRIKMFQWQTNFDFSSNCQPKSSIKVKLGASSLTFCLQSLGKVAPWMWLAETCGDPWVWQKPLCHPEAQPQSNLPALSLCVWFLLGQSGFMNHESTSFPRKRSSSCIKGGLDLLYFGSLAASPKSSWIWRLLFVSRLGFRGNCVAFCVNLAPVWTTEIPFKGQTITGLWHFASALGRRKSQFDLRNLLPWETLDWSHSWGSGDLSS